MEGCDREERMRRREVESTQTWHMTSVGSAVSHSLVIVQRSGMT